MLAARQKRRGFPFAMLLVCYAERMNFMRRAAGIKRAVPGILAQKPDGEVNALKMSNRARVRAVVFLAALFAVLGGLAVQGQLQAAESSRNLQYTYDRAMGDLNDCVSSMQTTLEKSLYANTATQQNGLAARILREASMAKSSLSVLPVSDGALFEASRFITQAGDFAMSLSRRISAGQEMTQEEHETLQQLGEYAAKLSETLSAADPDFSAPSSSEWKDTEDLFTDYPTLIYDGPFSDHIAQREPAFLAEEEEIAQGNAQNVAASFLGVSTSELTHEGDTAGTLPAYNFTSGTKRVSVSRAGGRVISLIDSREVGEAVLSKEEASEAALSFLESRGLSHMTESYYAVNDGICTINYAYEENGVICYPDLVKVSVALDNGSIAEFDSSGFLMNHQARTLAAPKLTAQEASANISPYLTPDEGRLALIPTAGLNEVLTYEYLCQAENGEEVLVYLNADTGMEEQILILLRSDNGVLTR